MRYIVLYICILTAFPFCSVYSGDTSANPSSPFSVGISYLGDGVSSFSGGIRPGTTYLGLANFEAGFDTEKAALWKGGRFCAVLSNTHGGTPSQNLIGDFQVASNIEAGSMTFFHELWFRQDFNRASTIIGLQDLNAEFASSTYGSTFLNSSFGVHATIASNIPSPVYPQTAFGLQVQYRFSERMGIKMAVFDGLPEGYKHPTYNLSWAMNFKEGYLAVAEFSFEYHFSKKLPGEIKGGVYHHHCLENGWFAADRSHENGGVYLVTDQALFRNNMGDLSAFMQASVSPKTKNSNCHYLGVGLHYTGFSSRRPEDILGLAVARAGFQNSIYPAETTMELTYHMPLNEHVYVQPDLQYVIHPSGTGEHLNNALAGILRMGLQF